MCILGYIIYVTGPSQVVLVINNLLPMQEMQETQVPSLGWEEPLEEENGNPLQYSCLKNSMDKRSLLGNHPWGHKELDTNGQPNTCTHVYIS